MWAREFKPQPPQMPRPLKCDVQNLQSLSYYHHLIALEMHDCKTVGSVYVNMDRQALGHVQGEKIRRMIEAIRKAE